MADNLDVTPGTGATVAADLVSGALHQRIKLSVGADGEAKDLDSGSAVIADSIAVNIASDQTVPVSGSLVISSGSVVITSMPAVSVTSSGSTVVTSGSVSIIGDVTGDFYQANQPISGSVNLIGTSAISGSVVVSSGSVSIIGTVPVSGTFYQETQPVSGSMAIIGTSAISGSVVVSSGSVAITSMPEISVTSSGSTVVTSGSISVTSMPAITVTDSGSTVVTSGSINILGTVPVSGTFYQADQPISGSVVVSSGSVSVIGTVPVSGTFYQADQTVSGSVSILGTPAISGSVVVSSGSVNVLGTVPVSGTFYQETQPVSGSFWQTTQPVSGSVSGSITSMPTVAVTGTFYQETQPVSGSVSVVGTVPVSGSITVTSAPTTAVTGTFYQAIQPVSGSVSGSITSMPEVAVTGAFYPATQPVSGSISVTSAPTTAVTGTFWQTTQPVSGSVSGSITSMPTVAVTGTFYQATQPVSGSVVLLTGTNTIGALTANQSVSMTSGSLTGSLPAGTASIGKLTDDQKVDINKVAGASVAVSNGTAATSLRVTVASDSTGQIQLASGSAAIGSVGVIGNVGVTGTFYQATQPVSGSMVMLTGSNVIGALTANQSISGSVVLLTGANAIGKLASNDGVDIGNVDVTSVVTGTAATNLGKAEDAQHSSGDVGVMALAVRKHPPAALATADSDYIPLMTDQNGFLAVASYATGGSSMYIQGTVAHDGAAANNPVLNGAKAVNAEQTAVGNADVVMTVADLTGKLITLPYANPENFVSGSTVAILDTTRTAVIAAQGGSVRTYLTDILVTNGHSTVGTIVKIEDNTTCKYTGYAGPLGGFSATLPVPLVGTANTAWNVSATTTGGSIVCSLSGYKGI